MAFVPDNVNTRFELLLLGGCLAFGLTVLPALVYFVGLGIFGDYAGGGLGAFLADFHGELWRFSLVVWFLVLSPYCVVQSLRGTLRLYRRLRAR